MGLGTIGWGFSKTDGVPVGLVESQWGCLESQWGRLSMEMLQGVVVSKLPLSRPPLHKMAVPAFSLLFLAFAQDNLLRFLKPHPETLIKRGQ